MSAELPDWMRLQKALAVEAERGFIDLMGKQYRFSEFLSLSFGKHPVALPLDERRRWQEFAAEFAIYPQLKLEERQHLVASARRYLYQMQSGESQEAVDDEKSKVQSPKSKVQSPRTTPLVQSHPAEVTRRLAPDLDQPLTSLAEVGAKKGSNLARLGLHTVRDVLFYYPRDHIDYARQVNIRDLQPGETVTLVGMVKSCTCFNSPRNPKLTILEVVLKDNTGQIRLGRFFAGARYNNRGWQEQQKRRYPTGAVVAASGLVKKSKYNLTLEDPELEVLAHPGDKIDSQTIGRVVPVYSLTEGVAADLVRQTVIAALPAAALLQEPLPANLREKYGLMGLSEAIANIHFPADSDTLEIARRRLVFDEFFYLQLGLLQRQHKARQNQTSAVLTPTGQLIDQFYQQLPFKLTGAQQRVINDILNDLQKPAAMNRLVQGMLVLVKPLWLWWRFWLPFSLAIKPR